MTAPARPELLRWPTPHRKRIRPRRVPATISNLSAFGGTESVLITWDVPSSSSSITSYDLQRSTTSATTGFADLAAGLSPVTSYVDASVSGGTQYWYRIRANNAQGAGAYTDAVTATPTTAADPPAAISDLAATAGTLLVDLAWTAPASTEAITSYDVQQSIVSDAGPWTDVIIDLAAPATSYQVTGLTADQLYYFRVRATSSEGDGAWSNIDSATPTEATPQISIVGSSEFDGTSSATTHAITLPSGIEADDLICIWSNTQSGTSDGAPTAPGFTQVYTQGGDASFRPKVTMLRKVAAGTESGTSVTLTWGVSCDANMVCVVFRGVDTTTPIDQTSPAGATTPDPPSITTVTDKAWVLAVVTGNHSTSMPTPTISAGYSTAATQVPDLKAIVVTYKEVATAAAENPAAWTWGVENCWAATTALRPAAVTPPPTAAFPVLESVTETNTTSGTTHSIDLPATVDADDRLAVAVVGFHSSFTAGTSLEGWTLAASGLVVSTFPYFIYTKKAAGNEGGTQVDFVSSVSTSCSAQVFRVSGVDTSGGVGTSLAVQVDASTSFSLTPNPPAVTSPWGSAKNLAVAGFFAGASGGTVTANPAGYTAGADGAAASSVWLGSAWAEVEAASADPGAFTIDDGTAGENLVCWSLLFRPTVGGSVNGTAAPTIPSFTSTVTITTTDNAKSIIEAAAAGTHITFAAGTHTINSAGIKLKSDMHIRLATGATLTGSGYCFRPADTSVTGVVIGGDTSGARPVITGFGGGTSSQDYGAIMGRVDDPLGTLSDVASFTYADVDDWFIYHLDFDANSSNGVMMGSNFTLYDCEFHGHTVTGAAADRVVGGLIHSCLFYWNALNPASGASSNGANFKGTWINANVGRTDITPTDRTITQFIISNCTFEALDRDGGPGDCNIGAWLDLDCNLCLVEYSTFDDHPTTSIFVEGGNYCEISNNIVRNSDGFGPAYNGDFANAAIAVGESTNCNIHDNTIYDSTYGLMNRMSNRTSDWYNSNNAGFVNYAWPTGPRYWLNHLNVLPSTPGKSNMWTGANTFEGNTLYNCSYVVINEGTDTASQTTHGSTDLASIHFVGNNYDGSAGIRFYNASSTQLTLAQWQALAYDRDQ